MPESHPTRHTPGPWTVGDNDVGPSIYAGDQLVVELVSGETDNEADANACLLAAAPVLLEACRHSRQFIGNAVLMGYLAPQPGTPEAQALSLLDAAIAQAERQCQEPQAGAPYWARL
jgi:hypothetical protein